MKDFLNFEKMNTQNRVRTLKALGALSTEKVEVQCGYTGQGGVAFVHFTGFRTGKCVSNRDGVSVYPAERGNYGGEEGYILRVKALGIAFFVAKNAIKQASFFEYHEIY